MLARHAATLAVTLFLSGAAQAGDGDRRSAETLYDALCAECHGSDRLGGVGPVLLPENLRRLDQEDAEAVIADGRSVAQMPAFGHALDAGREIATIPIDGMPNLASGITWEYEGRRVVATPHLREAAISVVDMERWEVIRQIETKGPGFFLRSHDDTGYAWVDVFFGPHRDLMHVIDKNTLEIVETLQPEEGKTSAHVEFTRDGSHALVSLWEMDGALVIYDAESLKKVKRLPMRRPSGKYNLSNRID